MAQVSSDTRHTVAGGPRVGCVMARSPVTRWSEHGEQTLVHGTWYCYMVLATSTVSKLWYMVLVHGTWYWYWLPGGASTVSSHGGSAAAVQIIERIMVPL